MKNSILSMLPAECPSRDTLYWFESIDSTNNEAKHMAAEGAPHGTVLLASQQTGGRGRMGRSFSSPKGKGIYLSMILRPDCAAEALMHLTCGVGVAMCDAVEEVTGFRPGIKWINDLIANNKKLGGILTELSIQPATGTVAYAIAGIGINCSQTPADFPPELRETAISLENVIGKSVNQPQLAAAMIRHLLALGDRMLTDKEAIMKTYRTDCVILNRPIMVHRNDTARSATAVDIDTQGGLVVRYDDGVTETVNSGEVSVRGLCGYV